MKKIYYLTDQILDDKNVSAIHVDEICKNLFRLNYSVTLFAPATKKFNISKDYKIKLLTRSPFFNSLFFQFILLFKLIFVFWSKKPDLIYSRHNIFLFVPVLIGKLYKIPVILEINGRVIQETKSVDKSYLFRFLVFLKIPNIFEYFIFHMATGFVAMTVGIKSYLIENCGMNSKKISVISSAVDQDIFKPTSKIEARQKLKLDEEAIYIGYVGSFFVWQGIKYVVDAAKIVCEKVSNAKFLIVGAGDDNDFFKNYITENKLDHKIELCPAVCHKYIPHYINAIDIGLCYPDNTRDGATSPFKVYEYLACEKSTIVSDIGGLKEEFGSSVEYVPAESPGELADKIVYLINNKDERERLGEEGRKFIKQGKSWNLTAKKIMDLYDKLTCK